MPRLIPYPGEQNKICFFHDGYKYHCEWYRNRRSFRCIKRGQIRCPGKIVTIDEDGNIDENKTRAHHGHDQDMFFIEKLEFKRELFRRCQETGDDLAAIWNNMTLEFPNVVIHLRHGGLLSSMYKYRRLRTPLMPENLRELAERIGEYDPIRSLYIGHCEDDNGGIALMFMHQEMREPLRECTALFGDGTFKIRPRNPRDIAQVYTFQLMKNLSGFPAFFFITNARTADLYKAMLRQMIRVIPELAQNLRSISIDYERSIITAVREVFPDARLSGCLFHYIQALRRYWYWKCHIPENFHNILEYAMALAYLPAERMEEGFNVVMGLMVHHNVPNAERFNNYFRRQWLPLANVISIHGRRVRTNNVCENFHLHAKTYIGVRQGLWLMLERLGKLANIFVIRYQTAVYTGILYWSWPAELLRADRDLIAMEPTLPEIGVRQYLEFVVRQRRGRFLPELENDNENENENDGLVNEGDYENDVLVDELNRIGLHVFIAQDEIGAVFEIGVPEEHRMILAPVQVRVRDLPDGAEFHNPFAPRGRGRGARGRGGARRRAAGARGREGAGRVAGRGRARGARGGAGRGRGRAALPPVEEVPQDIPEVEAPVEEVRQEVPEVDIPVADPQGLQVPREVVPPVIQELPARQEELPVEDHEAPQEPREVVPPVIQELPARQEELPVEDHQAPQGPGEVVVEPPNVAYIPAEQDDVHREDIQNPVEPAAEIIMEPAGLGMPAVENQEDIQEKLPLIEEAAIQPINEPLVVGEEIRNLRRPNEENIDGQHQSRQKRRRLNVRQKIHDNEEVIASSANTIATLRQQLIESQQREAALRVELQREASFKEELNALKESQKCHICLDPENRSIMLFIECQHINICAICWELYKEVTSTRFLIRNGIYKYQCPTFRQKGKVYRIYN